MQKVNKLPKRNLEQKRNQQIEREVNRWKQIEYTENLREERRQKDLKKYQLGKITQGNGYNILNNEYEHNYVGQYKKQIEEDKNLRNQLRQRHWDINHHCSYDLIHGATRQYNTIEHPQVNNHQNMRSPYSEMAVHQQTQEKQIKGQNELSYQRSPKKQIDTSLITQAGKALRKFDTVEQPTSIRTYKVQDNANIIGHTSNHKNNNQVNYFSNLPSGQETPVRSPLMSPRLQNSASQNILNLQKPIPRGPASLRSPANYNSQQQLQPIQQKPQIILNNNFVQGGQQQSNSQKVLLPVDNMYNKLYGGQRNIPQKTQDAPTTTFKDYYAETPNSKYY